MKKIIKFEQNLPQELQNNLYNNIASSKLKKIKEAAKNLQGTFGQFALAKYCNNVSEEETELKNQHNTKIPLLQFIKFALRESIKNTYDSVIVRNYLASMTPKQLSENEPLIYAIMQKNNIENITPSKMISCVVSYSYSYNDNKSQLTVVDNGCGPDIWDAFKFMHSQRYRTKHADFIKEYIDKYQLSSDVFAKTDNIYGRYPQLEIFCKIGLRAGGEGLGARTEVKYCKTYNIKFKRTFGMRQNNKLGAEINYIGDVDNCENKKTLGIKIENNKHVSNSISIVTLNLSMFKKKKKKKKKKQKTQDDKWAKPNNQQ